MAAFLATAGIVSIGAKGYEPTTSEKTVGVSDATIDASAGTIIAADKLEDENVAVPEGIKAPPVVKKAAVVATAPKAAKAVTVKSSGSKKKSAPSVTVSATAKGGWSTARVSWYGPGFYGKHTASGKTLTPSSMVVAHRSLPFGTRIEFSYHGRTAIGVVEDRGPFVGGRTFDLGPGVATSLGFGGVGTVSYRIL